MKHLFFSSYFHVVPRSVKKSSAFRVWVLARYRFKEYSRTTTLDCTKRDVRQSRSPLLMSFDGILVYETTKSHRGLYDA